jgi:hypothetical protein
MNRLCAHYKKAAPYQEQILDAFEVARWQHGIDTPINQDKLRDTIKDLQKKLKDSPICIERDGTKGGLLWRVREQQ